ncbi:MAG: isochorismatase family cysteine hydrolase [Propionicimonas sp.]|uniref:isochorismatase family cysteine hydrolase n=1 Tax=Propionicimonas sp. TaxID=1955623 RepID=UPI003D133D66
MDPSDSWTQPHLDRSALLVIDVQADFLDGGALPVPGTSSLVPSLGALTTAFRRAGRPLFHVVRLYAVADVDLVRRGLVADGVGPVRPGPDGARVPAGLLGRDVAPDPDVLLAGRPQEVGPGEWLLWKPRWSAFHRTGLEDLLRALDVDTVVVAGCNLPNCPRATILDASQRDFRVVMVVDAISGGSDERWGDLRGIGAVGMATADLVAALGDFR